MQSVEEERKVEQEGRKEAEARSASLASQLAEVEGSLRQAMGKVEELTKELAGTSGRLQKVGRASGLVWQQGLAG